MVVLLLICQNISQLGCIRKGSGGERLYSQGPTWAIGSSEMEFFKKNAPFDIYADVKSVSTRLRVQS